MKKVLAIILIGVASSKAMGQSLADTVRLKEVFVTSARQITERAFYIKTIDSVVLANTAVSDLSDLLQNYSSLYVKTYGVGGLSTASFRGTSASHTQVLWNGLSINSPLWGQTDLSMMPVFFTDEVSLLYGSSSLAKTSGGLGGCISLNNTPDWNAGTQISYAQTAGSFGYLLSQLKWGYSRNKIVSSTRFFYDKAKNDFRYLNNANGLFNYPRQKNADYIKNGFLQEFYYKLSQRQFAGIKVMSTWGDRNFAPIMSNESAHRHENQKDNSVNITGEWKYYGTSSNWSFNMGLIRNTLDYVLLNFNSEQSLVNSVNTRSESNVFSNKLNFQQDFSSRTVLKSSAELHYTSAHYTNREEKTGFSVNRTDVSLQSSVHHVFNNLLSGYILVHQKMVDSEIMPFIGAMGLEFKPSVTSEFTIRSNLGRNLHVPTLNDKYFDPGGNPDLRPEVGYQADAGVQYVKTMNDIRYQIEITGFAAWIEDWILWHPSEFRYWTADNVEQVFSRGTEVNASIKGSLGEMIYQVKGNYAYTRTTNEERESPSKGMQLIYIPRHVGNVQFFLERGTFSTFLSCHNTGVRYASTVEEASYQVPGYYLMDFGAGKTFKVRKHSLYLNFRLNNVLNKQYQVIQYRAMPGRNYAVTLSFNFGNNVN